MSKYFFIVLFLCSCLLNAQDILENRSSFLDRTEFKVAYSGNLLWNNGLNMGAEYLWKERSKIKEKKRKTKHIRHQLLVNTTLGYSTNFLTKTDNGAFINSGLMWRRMNTKGKQISITINPLGYYRSFLPETYEVKGDQVKKVFLPGRSYYAPSISVGFGKERKGKRLSGRYFNVNLMYRSPYNGGRLPSLSFQYGYRFSVKRKK